MQNHAKYLGDGLEGRKAQVGAVMSFRLAGGVRATDGEGSC